MLKLKYETECWQAAIANEIDRAEMAAGVDLGSEIYEDSADQFRRDVCNALSDAGVDYERAYQQSVGTQVIVQAGTKAERDAFDTACESAIPAARKAIARVIEVSTAE